MNREEKIHREIHQISSNALKNSQVFSNVHQYFKNFEFPNILDISTAMISLHDSHSPIEVSEFPQFGQNFEVFDEILWLLGMLCISIGA